MGSAHELISNDAFMSEGGEMGTLLRRHDWFATPLGPPENWPQPLKTVIRLALNTRHPMYVFWGPDGLCFYNDAYRQSIGPERHPSSIGRPALQVWAEIWPVIGPQIAQVMAGGGPTWHENQLVPITRNGRQEEVYWTYSYGPIDDDSSPNGIGGVLVVCTETTEQVMGERRQREATARLLESETQLRLATEAAEIGLWDLDMTTDLLFWPPRVKTMFGISADVAISMSDFYAGLHPLDAENTTSAFAAAINPERRAVYDVEYRTVGKEDGVIRWVAAKGRGLFDDQGRCVRVIGTAIDITARKQIEQRLLDLNNTLEQRVAARTAERDRVWRNSRDLLVVVGADGIFCAVNPAWTTLLGHDADEVVGRSFLDFIWPEDAALTQGGLDDAAAARDLTAFENRYRHRDGGFRWISWHTSVEGEFVYGYGRDVTAERDRQAELDRAQDALRQAQKMDAMGQLTGGVAHDFNNLLTPIVGALDLLGRSGLGGARERRLIAGAAQSAERAKTLVQRLLAFARRQPLQTGAVDVARLVGGMAELIGSTSGPQIRLVVDAPDGLPRALADYNQLEMALLNLAVNARDAMPDGGVLRISGTAEPVDAGHPIKLHPGSYVKLSVADTGVGMDKATLSRAVEPFFSTKGVGRGTGLGLSMVHGLASQLGGALVLHSEPGVGTNVDFWLPVSQDDAGPSSHAGEARQPHQGKGTALLVDDEELVRISAADMLGELGYTVVEASSAEVALTLIRGGLCPDLLVSDHLMPGMTGSDLARLVRSERPGTAVLIVSGYAESEGVAPDLPRLSKPFVQAELAAILAEVAPV